MVCRMEESVLRTESVDGIRCHRVVGFGANKQIRRLSTTPAPFNPTWTRLFRKLCQINRPDLIFVRDVPLSPLALKVGAEIKCPVIVDIAENHPAMWKNVLKSDRFKISSFFLKNPRVAELFEQGVIKKADSIFVVVNEMKDRLVSMGAVSEKIHIVSNTPPSGNWPTPLNKQPLLLDRSAPPLDLVYVGHVSRTRGIELVVQAISKLKLMNTETNLHIIGSGDYLKIIEKIATDLEVRDLLILHGWIPNEQLSDILSKFDVGVIPHLIDEHTDTTIPNKLFDYMAQGLPSLVAGAKPLSRIVKEENCGLAYDGTVDDMVKQILRLKDPILREKLSRNGRAAFETKYHWEIDFDIVKRAMECFST